MRIERSEIDKQYGYMHKIKTLIGGEKKIYMLTFGCQQNEADSERLVGMAQEMGYTVTEEKDEADLIIINTCAIREHAEKKALSITGQCKHLKTKNPELVIAICGCMVTQGHRADAIKHSYPYVDILLDTSMVYRFPEILYTKMTSGKRQFMLDPESKGNIPEGLPQYRENKFKAWLSVMYGCNNFCTYCIVPYVRGRERSRLKEDILREARELVSKGYKEITLLGQNVNSYGKDLEEDYDFSDLLKDICAIEGDFIIRFMTSHPKDATHKLIDTMASENKIAKHFHLPLQAGNNRVLDKMNRKYTREKYLSLVDYMREKMPDIGLTTDIIVGFPTETEEEFEDTLDILRRVGFDNIYSFIYSPRKGTPAAEMEGQIPDDIKGERFQRLLDTQNEISFTRNLNYERKPTKVLVEGWSKTDKSMLTGRNEKNRLVHFKGDESLIGTFVDVMITEAETYSLFGELI
ncbi:MAG: tRNA (N6-isopentenyl adenosine(37)-C2)-methylthiotransferase MiaB [Ruminococcaceae bacterium]|nr:tRNA (N6-isopentenyl adenosine(37)-C2)-methylthiotransferase MiaB [Oscillospiraceae bacterium]